MGSRRTGLLFAAGLGFIAALAACSRDTVSSLPGSLVTVPGGQVSLGSAATPGHGGPRELHIASFALGRHEVTVGEFCRFLNDARDHNLPDHPQIILRGGRYRPAAGQGNKAMAWVRFDDAQAYCRWVSGRLGRTCRLPTVDEWESAAQTGVRGAPFPWGWGDPHGRAAFDLGAPLRVGLFPPNRLGLHDLAGGVAEWCVPDDEATDEVTAKGGSWAERDPDQLVVYGGVRLPRTYRDADVGFRIAAELEGAAVASAQAHP